MQEMAKLEAAGAVQYCSELRACGTFVCEYETLYTDSSEPMYIQDEEQEEDGSSSQAEEDT